MTRVPSVTDGGDCRMLPLEFSVFVGALSDSAVPGGVGSSLLARGVVLTEGVLRCLVRYELDLGSSGLGEEGEWAK